MLTPDNVTTLPVTPRRSTGVSQALRALREEIECRHGKWDITGSDGGSALYRLTVASDRATRERAYRLAHRVYERCGYAASGSGLCVCEYDLKPATLTLLIEDMDGRDIGTVSLVFDSAADLPCDEIYRGELDGLRARGCKLVEVTRLVMDEAHAHSRLLLIRMFNCIQIFAHRVRHATDFVIEVNPTHVNYYRRLLKFDVLGEERPCPRVKGAPAVLLRLNLAFAQNEIERFRGAENRASERSLYPYAYGASDEREAADFMARGCRPMNLEDARYFNLVPCEKVAAGALAAAGR